MQNEKLRKIQKRIDDGHIYDAARALTDFATERNLHGIIDTVEGVVREYDMMLQFMAQGFMDPKRGELLNGIKRRLSDAVSNSEILCEIQTYHFYTSQLKRLNASDMTMENVRQDLEDYVAELAMASLDLDVEVLKKKDEDSNLSKAEILNSEHHKFMSLLFVKVCCSLMWTRQEHRDYTQLCLSPTIDRQDQQLIVSAITLGCVRFFDRNKWFALTDIYLRSQDDDVRQRAFVGWVLALVWSGEDDEEINNRLSEMCLDPATIDALVEMQMEMLFCSKAEKDQQIINNEIVPGIIKNSNYKITPHGLEELETDELEEVLHPEKADEKLEATQKYFDRMLKMQKDGSDVYFSGFSQMKRFAFFYNISNWFIPFYPEHPELVSAMKNKESLPMTMKIVEELPLCNSDRYSFLLGVSTVIDKLPKDVVKAMRSGEIRETPLSGELSKRTRLLYLQDIYRYVRLFPEEKMLSEDVFTRVLANNDGLFNAGLEGRIIDILKALRRAGFKDQLDSMLYKYTIWAANSVDFHLIEAKRFVERGEYLKAFMDYMLSEMNSNGRKDIVKATAKAAMLCGKYREAAKRYEVLLKSDPDNLALQLNCCYAKVCNGDAEKVVDDLFRIEFETFDSGNDRLAMNSRRTLALALFSCNRHDESLSMYRKIVDSESSTLNDRHALGLALWIDGKAKDALPILRDFCRQTAEIEKESLEKCIGEMYVADVERLGIYNADFTADDLRMMCEVIQNEGLEGKK